MKLAERDFRLAQVRKEKANVELQLKEMEDEAKRKAEVQEAKTLRLKEANKREREARNNRPWWRKHFWDGLVGTDYSDRESSEKGGLMGIGESLVEVFFTAKFQIPLFQELEKKLKELTEEEAKLLGVKIDDEPKSNDREMRKNEIFQKRARRQQEKQQLIKDEIGGKPYDQWTDEDRDRVKRIENVFEQADARDLEELGKLL